MESTQCHEGKDEERVHAISDKNIGFKLNAWNIISAINSRVVVIVRYDFGTLKRTEEDLTERNLRKLL